MLWLLILLGLVGAPNDAADAPMRTAGSQAPSAAEGAHVAEPQVPSGRFTTAVEVKPILAATRANWVAVRVYGGQDLVYVTHLLAWRCGLVALRYGINGAPLQDWPLPKCHEDSAAPNALLPEDGLPYVTQAMDAVQTIDIEIVFDDLSTDRARFERASVLIP